MNEAQIGLALMRHAIGTGPFPDRLPRDQQSTDRLFQFIKHHKIQPYIRRSLTLDNATIDRTREQLITRIDSTWPDLKANKSGRDRFVLPAATLLSDLEPRPLLVKGAAYHLLVEGDTLRPQNDVDLCVPDLDCLWRTASHLLDQGYHYSDWEGGWLQPVSRPDGIQVHGGIALSTDDRELPHLDLHSGLLTMGLTGMLSAPVWERALTRQVGSSTVLVPTPEDYLLLSIAHQYNHGHFLVRDLLDAARILDTHPDIDTTYLLDQVRSNELEPGLAHVCQSIVNHLGLGIPSSLEFLLEQTAAGVQSLDRSLAAAHRRPGLAAIGTTTRCTYQLERSAGMVRALGTGFRNVIKQLGIQLAGRPRWRWLCYCLAPLDHVRTAGRFLPGHQVALALVEIDPPDRQLIRELATDARARVLGEESVLIQNGKAEVLATTAGWFLPVSMAVPRQTLIRHSLELLTQLSGTSSVFT